jgi:hypothetical protein
MRTRKPPSELRAFLAAFPPPVARLFLATRRAVLAAAPDANELIYDAYNAVSAAYSFTERLKEAFCHVAAYPGHVNLGFNRGAGLDDPAGILVGTGARIRHVRVSTPADLRAPALRALLRAAVAEGRTLAAPPSESPTSRIRPVSGRKRRPRAARG